MGDVLNFVPRNFMFELSLSGLTMVKSFLEGVHRAKEDHKLLLVYFLNYDDIEEDKFFKILQTRNVNSLLREHFYIYISNNADEGRHFNTNYLYVLSFVDCVENDYKFEAEINVVALPAEELLFELYKVHLQFDEYKNKIYLVQADIALSHSYDALEWSNMFPQTTIEDALDSSIYQPVKHLRKILVVYMYNPNSILSKEFDEFMLKNEEYEKYHRFLVPIAMDISQQNNHKAYLHVCKTYFDDDILAKTINSAEDGVFLFIPDDSRRARVQLKLKIAITKNSSHSTVDITSYFQEFFEYNQITDINEMNAVRNCKMPISQLLADQNEEFDVSDSNLHDITQRCCQEDDRKMFLLHFVTAESILNAVLASEFNDMRAHSGKQLLYLPWNIEESKQISALAISLKRTFGNKKLENILKNGKSALFLFVPIANVLILYAVFDESTSKWQLRKGFDAAFEFFTMESMVAEKFEATIGLVEYQQYMCDQLGDRDYDCFKLNENEVSNLRDKIAFAYYGPPQEADGNYTDTQNKQIDIAFRKLKKVASRYTENLNVVYISFLRICITPLPQEKQKKSAEDSEYNPYLDFSLVPIFRIRKCFNCPADNEPCRLFVDHMCRSYESWEQFLEYNRYPAVMLIAPKNGVYTRDYRDLVQLEICPSPACGIGPAVLKGFDIGFGLLGGVAGVAGIVTASLAVPVVPFVALGAGIGVGVYCVARSSMEIYERYHQPESPSITEQESRAAYLNIIAGSLGFTTAGTMIALKIVAEAGVVIGDTTSVVATGSNIVNLTAGGAAIGNSAVDVVMQWSNDGVSNALPVTQLASSVLFFGHAVCSAHTFHTMQSGGGVQPSFMTGVIDALTSNRQRRTFMCLLSADAERASMNTVNNKEVIKYIVSDINNDALELYQVQTVMPVATARMRTPMHVAKANDAMISKLASIAPSQKAGATRDNDFNLLLDSFSPYMQQQVICIFHQFLPKLILKADLYKSFSSLLPRADFLFGSLEMIIQFFKTKVLENQANALLDNIEKVIVSSSFSINDVVRELIQFVPKWIKHVEQLRMKPHIPARRTKKCCQICKGTFYM